MDSTLSIQVGRVFTTAKGLFAIRLDDGVEVLGPHGEGMTKEMVERVLDAIEARQCERNSNSKKESV